MKTYENSSASSIEEWARSYLLSDSLAHKCAPGLPPKAWEKELAETSRPADQPEGVPLRSVVPVDLRPVRPPELVVSTSKPKSVKLGGLKNLRTRAQLVHKFWHHELQAAELMAWAILRFPDTPRDFRWGLARIARDEIRHMGLYQKHLESLGFHLGDFPVRDWFWERAVTCETPLAYVSFIGLGLEGANLEHTERFEGWFRLLEDHLGVEVQAQIAREEVAHVRFAARWFREWTGGLDFDDWCAALPPPITPMLLRGKSLRLDLRRKAELSEEFLERLANWQPDDAS